MSEVFRTPRRDQRYSFTLAGDRTDNDGEYTGEEWEESFTCLPTIPGSALEILSKAVGVNAAGEQVYNRPSVIGFLRATLPPTDQARFDALVVDPHRTVELEVLAQVMRVINDKVVNRPSTP